MNSFNKTEAAFFSCRLWFMRDFPFISLIHEFKIIILFLKIQLAEENCRRKKIILYSLSGLYR